MDLSANIDLETVTLDELENLDLDHFLGGDVTDFDLGDSMPDGVFGLMIEDYDLKALEAKPEENKKGRVTLTVKYKVTHVLACDDADIDHKSLINRVHYQRYIVTESWGVSQVIKTILGIVGAKFKDKKSWAAIGSSFSEIIAQLKSEKVQFGATIKTKERNGYENTDIVLAEKAFMSIEQFAAQVG